jgi:hypothetical protein
MSAAGNVPRDPRARNQVGMTTSLTRNVPSRHGRPPVLVPPAQTVKAATARRWQYQYSRRLRFTDALIVCAAVALAQLVRFGDSPMFRVTPARS